MTRKHGFIFADVTGETEIPKSSDELVSIIEEKTGKKVVVSGKDYAPRVVTKRGCVFECRSYSTDVDSVLKKLG